MKITRQHIKSFLKKLLITTVIIFLVFLLLNKSFPVSDNIEYSTIVTDNKGEVLHAYLTKDQQWRMKTELNEISPLLKKNHY